MLEVVSLLSWDEGVDVLCEGGGVNPPLAPARFTVTGTNKDFIR